MDRVTAAPYSLRMSLTPTPPFFPRPELRARLHEVGLTAEEHGREHLWRWLSEEGHTDGMVLADTSTDRLAEVIIAIMEGDA